MSGLRISKTTADDTVYYAYDESNNLIFEKHNNYSMVFHYDGNGVRTHFDYKSATIDASFYYRYNAQGDVIALLDSTGAIIAEYDYTAYGRQIKRTGMVSSTVGNRNPFRYRGYYYDTETDYYYLQSRYYDAYVGRFISADNVNVFKHKFQSLYQNNMYAYCWNNPVELVDPTGEFPWAVVAVGVLAVVSIVTSLVIRDVNYKRNSAQESYNGEIIDDQEDAKRFYMGFFDADWNGCGWVAVYNAMALLGYTPNEAEIIEYFDGMWNTLLWGLFGAAPWAVSNYLTKQGIDVTTNSRLFEMPEDIEQRARTASACILLYLHNNGGHYVTLKWNGTYYDAYNDWYNECASIKEYLDQAGTFMNIWFLE